MNVNIESQETIPATADVLSMGWRDFSADTVKRFAEAENMNRDFTALKLARLAYKDMTTKTRKQIKPGEGSVSVDTQINPDFIRPLTHIYNDRRRFEVYQANNLGHLTERMAAVNLAWTETVVDPSKSVERTCEIFGIDSLYFRAPDEDEDVSPYTADLKLLRLGDRFQNPMTVESLLGAKGIRSATPLELVSWATQNKSQIPSLPVFLPRIYDTRDGINGPEHEVVRFSTTFGGEFDNKHRLEMAKVNLFVTPFILVARQETTELSETIERTEQVKSSQM